MRYQAEHSDAPGPRPGGVTFSAVPNGEPATCPGGPMEPTTPRRMVFQTEGEFGPHHAKTAWGVIRYGRDEIVAILDSAIAGRIPMRSSSASRRPVAGSRTHGARSSSRRSGP